MTEVVFVGKDALPFRIGIEWERKSETRGLDARKPADALDELAVKRLSLWFFVALESEVYRSEE